ncbi:hypothetical protein [Mesorhizobium captivum]|uniref:hypothetical protein n=1 Tax=Mesorhizobium captivum TaxID=3072319 RepID=UPI002A247D05|nr:hypothetical protein [Mesorhizobium sp. VK3C]MDX8449630.1 hypothetical protein [Mesorhizobium sp. VK3C]
MVDNDLAIKISSYELPSEISAVLSAKGLSPAVLQLAIYVVRSRLRRSRQLNDRDRAVKAFEQLSRHLTILEPTPGEIELAAVYEAKAQALDLQLDTGESQLLAVLLSRNAALFLTGDKRAIVAIEEIIGDQFEHPIIGCLEQVIAEIVQLTNVQHVRSQICREPAADRALTLCFSCTAHAVSITSALEGLDSHIQALRSNARRTLLLSNNLSGLVP